MVSPWDGFELSVDSMACWYHHGMGLSKALMVWLVGITMGWVDSMTCWYHHGMGLSKALTVWLVGITMGWV